MSRRWCQGDEQNLSSDRSVRPDLTIQGEGALAGAPTMFVRFGGCDYRCSWCDSMYAVDPAQVRENAVKKTAEEIVDWVRDEMLLNSPSPAGAGWQVGEGMWVTLSGGNPALMDFDARPMEYAFVAGLQRSGFKIAVETQGSVWRPWLAHVDHLTVSPKPPSSGMATERHKKQTAAFIERAQQAMIREDRSLKIVVFDDTDYEWARDLIDTHMADSTADMQQVGDGWQTFISAGTDQDHLQDEYRVHAGIAERYRWLCEKVAADPVMRSTRVLPQLHVIAFGPGRGV